jgi:hypothetical protein
MRYPMSISSAFVSRYAYRQIMYSYRKTCQKLHVGRCIVFFGLEVEINHKSPSKYDFIYG